MSILSTVQRLFVRRPLYTPGPPPPPRLVLTQGCVAAVHDCLMPEIRRGHEGIAYLLGQSDGNTTLAVAAVRPQAQTTRGSFDVSAPAMARVVRAAVNAGLQVVGQVHTHPGAAFHSEGDDEGARIAFTGYVSLVLPEYGRHLPSLTGMAAYFFQVSKRFMELDPADIRVVPGRVE